LAIDAERAAGIRVHEARHGALIIRDGFERGARAV
jgi:hypothetical protein